MPTDPMENIYPYPLCYPEHLERTERSRTIYSAFKVTPGKVLEDLRDELRLFGAHPIDVTTFLDNLNALGLEGWQVVQIDKEMVEGQMLYYVLVQRIQSVHFTEFLVNGNGKQRRKPVRRKSPH